MKSKTRHVEDGGKNPRVHGTISENMSFKTNRRFKTDIQIQILKPKQRETPMTSKPRHIDGGRETQVHMNCWKHVWKTMRFENKLRFTKDVQIQIIKPKQRETPVNSKTRHVDGGGSKPRVREQIKGKKVCDES